MDSKTRFSTLETMCRERAQLAKIELEYWLAEANEWAWFKDSSDALIEDIPVQLDLCLESDDHQTGILEADGLSLTGKLPRTI
jgi:hypothetical protein